MAHGMDRGEAAAVRMLANPALSATRRRMIERSLVWRSGGYGVARMTYLRRVAARYARLLAAREGERG